MWWVVKLESKNKLLLIKNGSPVLSEDDFFIYIVAVRALEDGTGRKIQVSFDDGTSLHLSLDDFSPKYNSLKADVKAIHFAKQFAEQYSGQLQAASKTKQKSGFKKKHLIAAGVGGVLAVVATPFVLTAVGFTSAGIAASSLAASMMSTAAVANGGAIAAGSTVAVLQSVGAAGLGVAGTAAVGGAGAAAGAAVSGLTDAVRDRESSKE